MAKSKMIDVSAAEVRAHFAANPSKDLAAEKCLTAGVVRGRLSPKVIEAAAEAGLRYVPGKGKPEATVTVPVTKVNAKGAKRTVKREVPLTEARALLGEGAPARGRLSATNIAKIGEALAKA